MSARLEEQLRLTSRDKLEMMLKNARRSLNDQTYADKAARYLGKRSRNSVDVAERTLKATLEVIPMLEAELKRRDS